MTLIVGILCADGVVIGSDSAATFGPHPLRPTISQLYQQKIEIIDDFVIVAGTGAIGLGQRLIAITKHGWRNEQFKNKTEVEIGQFLAHETIKNFRNTGINPLQPAGNPENYGALVAMPCRGKHALIEFPENGFQPEVKTDDLWYASMGSGQLVADPLLGFIRETFWENSAPPSRQEGIFAATLVLTLSCAMAPTGVAGPIQMAILGPDSSKKGKLFARRLTDGELGEHEQSVTEAIKHFGEYREKLRGKGSQAPSPPTPPSSTP